MPLEAQFDLKELIIEFRFEQFDAGESVRVLPGHQHHAACT
jgi:hypothetical protein